MNFNALMIAACMQPGADWIEDLDDEDAPASSDEVAALYKTERLLQRQALKQAGGAVALARRRLAQEKQEAKDRLRHAIYLAMFRPSRSDNAEGELCAALTQHGIDTPIDGLGWTALHYCVQTSQTPVKTAVGWTTRESTAREQEARQDALAAVMSLKPNPLSKSNSGQDAFELAWLGTDEEKLAVVHALCDLCPQEHRVALKACYVFEAFRAALVSEEEAVEAFVPLGHLLSSEHVILGRKATPLELARAAAEATPGASRLRMLCAV